MRVKITARNGRGAQKETGGDYFRILLKSSNGKSSVSGVITDHLNGTYTGKLLFPILNIFVL